ncbi:MAG TPA: DUF190 domain-containing protein, partial [Myxococcota bacterium]|nr:DUF190 domain-containing protein [Myxococcota bacterium]
AVRFADRGNGRGSRLMTLSHLGIGVLVEVVDTPEHVERLLPILDEMVSEGMVTLETARVLKYLPGTRLLDAP